MRLYGGIDLHSNNHVLTIIDEQDRRVYERRLANDLSLTRRQLEPCRCVESKKLSNGKKKGEGNRKCGNAYLAWAFHEAAHFALRYLPQAKRFYERKRLQRNQIVAVRALAHKIARACYYVMRDQVPFAPTQLFAA